MAGSSDMTEIARTLDALNRIAAVSARLASGFPCQLLPGLDCAAGASRLGIRRVASGAAELGLLTDGFKRLPAAASHIGSPGFADMREVAAAVHLAGTFVRCLPARLGAARAMQAEVELLTRPFRNA